MKSLGTSLFLSMTLASSSLAFLPRAQQTWTSESPRDSAIATWMKAERNHAVSSRREFWTATAASLLVVAGSTAPPARAFTIGGKICYGDEDLMVSKAHGTSETPVQNDLLYNVNPKLADRICSYNRHFAEQAGYYKTTSWEQVLLQQQAAVGPGGTPQPVTFYDSVTGKPLFVAPVNRSVQDLLRESELHGWPSFRDDEVVWENVRVLRRSGETVSVDGTHLGHNLPDRKGNRYCINLVSVAGRPTNTV